MVKRPCTHLDLKYDSYRKPYAITLAIYDKLVAINHPDDVEENDVVLPDDL